VRKVDFFKVDMAARKRTPFQREEDLVQITRLYLQGRTQRDIAEVVGVSQGQVNHDLKLIQQRWRESSIMDMNEAKQRELARMDILEREYWAAWEQSKNERTRARQESDGKSRDGKPNVVRATMEREQRDGNPAFLAGVMSCIERRCKLLGLDAPAKAELTGKDGGALTVRIIYDDTDIDTNATQALTLAATGSA
jgi:predicted XRE-type DNA-binding protein